MISDYFSRSIHQKCHTFGIFGQILLETVCLKIYLFINKSGVLRGYAVIPRVVHSIRVPSRVPWWQTHCQGIISDHFCPPKTSFFGILDKYLLKISLTFPKKRRSLVVVRYFWRYPVKEHSISGYFVTIPAHKIYQKSHFSAVLAKYQSKRLF